jgi:RNA polymerase primary sigma factor
MYISTDGPRLTSDEEIEKTRFIQALERRARDLLDGIDVADVILRQRPTRAERTRGGSVNRLKAAMKAVVAASMAMPDDSEMKAVAKQIRAIGAEIEDLRSLFIMSFRYVCRAEGRKKATPAMTAEDLEQEGFIGLMKAAERFDPTRGVRFTTYCGWWVRAAMTRAITQTGRPIRLPPSAEKHLRDMARARKIFEASGVMFTLRDVAHEAGITREKAVHLIAISSVDWVEALDAFGVPLTEKLSDNHLLDPYDQFVANERLDGLEEDLTTLPSRQLFVLEQHYGLHDVAPGTLNSIGKEMGLSKERVRQIEAKAIRHLRSIR